MILRNLEVLSSIIFCEILENCIEEIFRDYRSTNSCVLINALVDFRCEKKIPNQNTSLLNCFEINMLKTMFPLNHVR